MGLAKREDSGVSVSCRKQVWARFIKEAENHRSNGFSHYCSTQGALSLRNHHPFVRQNGSGLPIRRYKRLRFLGESEIPAPAGSGSCSQGQSELFSALAHGQSNAWLQPGETRETQRTPRNLKLSKFEFQLYFYPRTGNTLSLVSRFIPGTPFTLKPLLLLFIPRLGHREEPSGAPLP